jgi:hypothetical protein
MSRPYLKPTAAAVDDMDRRRRGLPWMWMLVDDLDGFLASCPGDVDRRRVRLRARGKTPWRAREEAGGVRGVAMHRRRPRAYIRTGEAFFRTCQRWGGGLGNCWRVIFVNLPKKSKMGRSDGKLLELLLATMWSSFFQTMQLVFSCIFLFSLSSVKQAICAHLLRTP